MSKTLKRILIGLGILALLFIIVKMVGGKKDNGVVKVATEKAARRTIIETVNASGKIYPEVEVKITPDISGEVTELTVEEGDSVKRGQVLARVFADIYALQRDEAASRVDQSRATVENSNAALESLKANLEMARQSYDRNKELYNQKIISKAELEQFETTFRSAQANYNAALQNIKSLEAGVQTAKTGLTSANKNLGRATLIAPMDGVISSLKIKKGERVAGNSFNIGTEMMWVADMSVMELRVDVGENDIVKVKVGDTADVEVDAYNNRKFKGIVTQIASSAKSAAALATPNDVTNYEVKIRLERQSYQDLIDPARPKRFPFRPGMTASADIQTRRIENVLSVPIGAVNARIKGSDMSIEDKKKQDEKKKEDANAENTQSTTDNDREEVVFVLQNDGAIKKVVVRSGIQDINYIEIVNGIKEGEEVVTEPYSAISKTLKDGMKVKVVPKEELFSN